MHLRPATLLTAILAGLILLAPVTANAATTPTPSPTASTGTPETNPVVKGPNITVTLKDLKGGKGEPVPVPGVTLTVHKDSKTGEELGTQTTDQDRSRQHRIPGNGTYVVELDPEDAFPRASSSAARVRRPRPSGQDRRRDVRAVPDRRSRRQGRSFASKLIDAPTSGLKYGLIIALAALGLSLIFGTTGLTNFAHGELITFGGIMTYVVQPRSRAPVIAAGILAVLGVRAVRLRPGPRPLAAAAQPRHRPDRHDDRLDRLRAAAAQRLPVHLRRLDQDPQPVRRPGP